MLHIATVHWRSDRWIDIQRRFLDRFIEMPYRVYASLDGLPRDRSKAFYYATRLQGRHEDKLDALATYIAAEATTRVDDWLLFLDGDAFPVGNLVSYGRAKLSKYPLLAVQRRENNGDPQPHPSFCLTTVGFWQEIGATWSRGYQWEDALGRKVTDVGGNLLKILMDRGLEWYPMQRSNDESRGPVSFGIYDNVVYHHGAGFRWGCSRRATEEKKQQMWNTAPYRVLRFVHGIFPRHSRLARLRQAVSPTFWARQQAILESRRYQRRVFDRILHDDRFFEKL
jgi:hypothetical protein